MTDSIYRFFMQRVAEGRGLSAEATRAAAKGRVWSGEALAASLPAMFGRLAICSLGVCNTKHQQRLTAIHGGAPSVYAGADALAHGLVDKLGGLQDAVVLARQEAKLSEEVCIAAVTGGHEIRTVVSDHRLHEAFCRLGSAPRAVWEQRLHVHGLFCI